MSDLVQRLQTMRGPYLGDGVNPGVTTTEILAELDRLTRELEAARKDAWRYQRWRAAFCFAGDDPLLLNLNDAWNESDVDSVIDDAMSQEKRADALDRMARNAEELGLDY